MHGVICPISAATWNYYEQLRLGLGSGEGRMLALVEEWPLRRSQHRHWLMPVIVRLQPPRRHPYGDGQNGANGGAPRLIAVNRRSISGAAALPVRDRSTPVVIAGHTVQPLHPLSPRPQYDRVGSAFITHTSSGYTITDQGPRTSSGSGYNGGSGIQAS